MNIDVSDLRNAYDTGIPMPYSKDPERWKETHNRFINYLKSKEQEFEVQGCELRAKAALIRGLLSEIETTYYTAGLTKKLY